MEPQELRLVSGVAAQERLVCTSPTAWKLERHHLHHRVVLRGCAPLTEEVRRATGEGQAVGAEQGCSGAVPGVADKDVKAFLPWRLRALGCLQRGIDVDGLLRLHPDRRA